ncbi:Smr/MutS family protein [Oricola sp.]|uniref:Smr/MutS family protein n=1 Tax=Oricola sp. TaxID=1979950 RepID=UPI003BA87741
MNSRKNKRLLSEEEEILWHQVKRTVTPLSTNRPKLDAVMPTITDPVPEKSGTTPKPAGKKKAGIASASYDPRHQPPPVRQDPIRPAIDRTTTRKISKGRIAIDASIDLHEMTQAVAHDRLYTFLADCRSRGLRHVLVVTGKGRSLGSEGALKRMVPIWLNGGRFAELVSGFASAGRRHGGEGAIYVRLRKLAKADGSFRP